MYKVSLMRSVQFSSVDIWALEIGVFMVQRNECLEFFFRRVNLTITLGLFIGDNCFTWNISVL